MLKQHEVLSFFTSWLCSWPMVDRRFEKVLWVLGFFLDIGQCLVPLSPCVSCTGKRMFFLAFFVFVFFPALSLFFFLSFSLFLSLSLFFSLFFSLSFSLSLSLLLSLSLFLFFSLSLSFSLCGLICRRRPLALLRPLDDVPHLPRRPPSLRCTFVGSEIAWAFLHFVW